MSEITRRSFLGRTALGTAGGLSVFGLRAARSLAAQQPAVPEFKAAELEALRAVAAEFMEKHNVPGLSVAIAKEGRLVLVEGFGLADKNKIEKVRPEHLFRIASLSKPITSATIFRLVESGKLRLSDKVFGPKAVLGTDYGSPPYKPHVADLTLEHLLTHTSGGWQNNGEDPMFRHPKMTQQELIAWTIGNQLLTRAPGEHYAYSNFGYCILGRVIEKVTGKPYAEAVQRLVLGECGITGMRISGNTAEERAPSEVVYYDQDGESPYTMNVRRMDSHGGWLANPTDLVRFLVRVDGFPTKRDILEPQTIAEMTTGSTANEGYAKGWAVNKAHNWWHTGSLPGTVTIMVRTSGQFCWAALTNTRKANSRINADLDQLLWQMVGKINVWPGHDLFI